MHLFLLPENIFWTIILPAPNANTIHNIIPNLAFYNCVMALAKNHVGKPKGKMKVSKNDII